jgi:flagellar basal body-associated protein FliL
MARHAPASHSRLLDEPANDRLVPIYLLVILALAIGLTSGLAIGMSSFNFDQWVPSSRPTPSYIESGTVRATTSDGTTVTARVAIDVRNPDTRAVLEKERDQVALMLQNSVGVQPYDSILGASGMTQISSNMRTQLNQFLESRQVEPVHDVMIQDLLIKKR